MRTWRRTGSGDEVRICSNLETYECQLLASMGISAMGSVVTVESLTAARGSVLR